MRSRDSLQKKGSQVIGMKEAQAFGKLVRSNSDGQPTDWLSLADHCADVALCFASMTACNSIRRALESAAGRRLNKCDIDRLCVFAFLHDVGKASSGFQSKRWGANNRPQPDFWPVPTGHSREALSLFTEQNRDLAYRLPIDEMENWGDATWPLLIASCSHHGRPVVDSSSAMATAAWSPVRDQSGVLLYDPGQTLKDMADRVQALFPSAFEASENTLPDRTEFGHLFAGLVQFADWLGSDVRFFPIRDTNNRGKEARNYAERAVAALGLDSSEWHSYLNKKDPSFQSVFDALSPRPAQAAMADDRLGSLVILESETGSGKTEAAIWRFVHLFRTGKVDSLYFALPTRVSATQIYDRLHSAVANLWPENTPLTVRALPGYTAADDAIPTMLPEFKVQWSDDPEDEQACRRWAAEAPKRFLAAPISVGTIDQALLGILKTKHAHMRYAMLSRSLLIVDEVHASDTYMTVLLEKLLKAHLGNGGHALLLSATLGSRARTRFLALDRQVVTQPNFGEAIDTPYPAISDSTGLRSIAPTEFIKEVHWSLHDCMDDPVTIAEFVVDAAQNGAKVLVVRNTVPAAVALFRAVEAHPESSRWLFTVNDQPTLHHSRFSKQDRPLLDAVLESEFGKKRLSGPCVLIGTQTLEQSLDIDADLLITDLCPADVLLQRIGRLHRHRRDEKERPPSFRLPTAIVLTPRNYDLSPMLTRSVHGLGRFSDGGGIYADVRIIEATRRLIAKYPIITIPTDNRILVEGATHPECLVEIESEMGEAWATHGQQVAGDTGARRTMAHLHILDVDREFACDPNMAFPTDEKIGTRLGADDRLVQFDPPVLGPFGLPCREIPVRAHLLAARLSQDAVPEQIVSRDGTVEFCLGSVQYRYSRLGLERVKVE